MTNNLEEIFFKDEKLTMFQLVEKDGHRGIFIGEAENKPVIVTLKDSPGTMSWYGAMDYAKSQGLRLPTQRELMLIYIYKEELNLALKEAGGEPLEGGWHWSSSEYSDDYAWVMLTNSGGVDWHNKDNDYWRVRCVLDL